MNKQIPYAVVLSGCGIFDGSEINEAVLTLLALDELGLKYQCFAPDIEQAKVIDHFSGEATALIGDAEKFQRNVLSESARIARGKCLNLKEYKAQDFAGIIFPGGFGVAVNLSDFGVKGPKECKINEDVQEAIIDTYKRNKPIAGICLAPILIAKVLGERAVKVTIGSEKNTIKAIEDMGAIHQICKADEVCIDSDNKIVTVPAYMLAKSISEVYKGIKNLVKILQTDF